MLGQGITDDFQSKAAVRDIQLFDPAHYDIYDLYGSRGGGTRVRLIGNDLLNPDGSFDTSIMVTVGGEHATLIPFLSTDKQLVIDTPPKAPGRQDCCHSFRVWLVLRLSMVVACSVNASINYAMPIACYFFTLVGRLLLIFDVT